MAQTKNSTTTVKYVKDGVEQASEVPFACQVAESLDDAVLIAMGKLTEEESKADNAEDLARNKVLDYFNQVMETNARQSARAAFLTTVSGPDKQIASMAKKLASVKNISVEEAEKQIRALLG